MNSRFDGLRTVLGTAAVAVPEVGAPAGLSLRSTSRASAPISDLPDLSNLDRGLYEGDGAAITSSSQNGRDAGRGTERDQSDESLELDDSVFGTLPPSTAGATSPRKAAHVRRFPTAPRDQEDVAERRISGWTAAAVMVLGLFLGGTAAMAVFRADVAHILARLQ